MKKILVIASLGLAAPFIVSAQERGLGVGAYLGEPIGLSVKKWVSDQNAIDGAVGYSFQGDEEFHVHADYLWHKFDLLPYPFEQSPLYFGAGARVKAAGDDTTFGFRVPLGVSYPITQWKVDLFAEIGPVLDVAPGFKFEMTGGVGIRYWF